MSDLIDTCDECSRCRCGARYCPNADGPVCPWCQDDPEVDAA